MRKVVLNDIIQIISGGTPKTSINEYWNGDIGWLSINDFNNDLRKVYTSEKTITEKGLKESNTKILEVDDLIISARGTVGVLAQIGKPMAFNQSCFGLRGKKEIIDNTYLYYALKNYVSNIQKKGQGSVFNTINLDSFKLMEIDIEENLNIQMRIASVLASFDDRIELNNRLNDNLFYKFYLTVHEHGEEPIAELGELLVLLGIIIKFFKQRTNQTIKISQFFTRRESNC